MDYSDNVAGIPDLDERVLQAPSLRLKLLGEPSGSKYSHLACLGRWTTYSREALDGYRGRLPFDLWLEGLLSDRDIYCEAWVDGRWAPASWWRLVELEKGQGDRRNPNLHKLADQLRNVRKRTPGRKPELGEAACHLIDHELLSRQDAIDVAELMRCFDDVYPRYWTNNVNNGRKRLKRGEECRFCQNILN